MFHLILSGSECGQYPSWPRLCFSIFFSDSSLLDVHVIPYSSFIFSNIPSNNSSSHSLRGSFSIPYLFDFLLYWLYLAFFACA